MTIGRFEKSLFDKMGNNFGVGLSNEFVSLISEASLELKIVLNDAIVDHHDSSSAVAMRMSIFFRGTTVGCPARVPDAVGPVERTLPDSLFQVSQFAFGAADLQSGAIACHSNPRRIVPAVFQLPKAVDNDRHYPFLPDVSNNATHTQSSTLESCRIGVSSCPPRCMILEKRSRSAFNLRLRTKIPRLPGS